MNQAPHLKPGLNGGQYHPLSDSDIAKIADSAFEILAKSGMAVYSKTAMDALEKAGAQVDRENQIAKMPRSMVEDAIDSNPSSITLAARNDELNAVLEDGKVHYGTGGTSDSKALDIQAAYESAMSSLLVAMSGANYIHDIAGLMETDLTVSYEKLVMDNEILGMTQRVLRGIEVNDDTLATDLMIEKGPAKDYMVEEHTIKYMRGEFYDPTISNRKQRDTCTGDDSAETVARAKVREFLTTAPESKLDSATRSAILAKYPEIRQG
jgi:trimethylamine:corrinoid methyltransferase-like protein